MLKVKYIMKTGTCVYSKMHNLSERGTCLITAYTMESKVNVVQCLKSLTYI